MAAYTIIGTRIRRESDKAYIPDDPGNADYGAYLQWLVEGNMPDVEPDAGALDPVDRTFQETIPWQ